MQAQQNKNISRWVVSSHPQLAYSTILTLLPPPPPPPSHLGNFNHIFPQSRSVHSWQMKCYTRWERQVTFGERNSGLLFKNVQWRKAWCNFKPRHLKAQHLNHKSIYFFAVMHISHRGNREIDDIPPSPSLRLVFRLSDKYEWGNGVTSP